MDEKRFVRIAQPQPEGLRWQNTFCVHQGLGQRLNKQKNHSIHESGMDVFRICIYGCIACDYCTKFGIILASNAYVVTNLAATKVASNAYGAPYAKNAHFCFGRFERFLLVGKSPKPFESQVPCELRTLWALIRCRICFHLVVILFQG